MPLLRKKTLERSKTLSEFLKDDEEVFHCEITNEIFRNYEEYCERIILVNSMVWSCAMTGRPNLTYAEALTCEEEARKSLEDFPYELRTPIIYLASLTKRSWLGEMLEDVHLYARDRYFIGEILEACFDNNDWRECQILSAFEPTTDDINNFKEESSEPAPPGPPAILYQYEVSPLEGEGAGDSVTVSAIKIRRQKGVYTRPKNKLFLKQFIEQNQGVFPIKEHVLKKYNILRVKFSQIFVGNPPDFQTSKRNQTKSATASKLSNGVPNQTKKPRQETMSKYLTKTEKFQGTKQSNAMTVAKGKDKLHKINKVIKRKQTKAGKNNKNLVEEMKRLRDEMNQKIALEKQFKAEEKMKEKAKKLMEET